MSSVILARKCFYYLIDCIPRTLERQICTRKDRDAVALSLTYRIAGRYKAIERI
jgi:hypothetical protein